MLPARGEPLPGACQLALNAEPWPAGSQAVPGTAFTYGRLTETWVFRSSPPVTVCSSTVPIPRT